MTFVAASCPPLFLPRQTHAAACKIHTPLGQGKISQTIVPCRVILFSKYDNEGVASTVRRVAKENVQGTHMGGAEEALFVGSCVYAPEAMRSFTLSARLHWALASTGAELCLWVSSGQYSSAARDPCMLLQTCSAHASQMVQSSLHAHSNALLCGHSPCMHCRNATRQSGTASESDVGISSTNKRFSPRRWHRLKLTLVCKGSSRSREQAAPS